MYTQHDSPLNYLILSFYILMLSVVVFFKLSTLEVWVVMELATFTFVGLSLLTFMKYGHSSQGLISYFLIQSGFSMLLFMSLVNMFVAFPDIYLYVCYVALYAKLGVLPLGLWVYPVFSQLNGSVLYNAMTFQKIPLFTLLSSLNIATSVTLTLICLNLFIAGLLALSSSDIQSLIIFSSIANNSWLLASLIPLNFFLFVMFYLSYMLGLYFIMFSSSCVVISISLLSLSGLPPFPLFFIKLMVVMSILNLALPSSMSLALFLLTLSGALISSSYIRLTSSILICNFNSLNYVS